MTFALASPAFGGADDRGHEAKAGAIGEKAREKQGTDDPRVAQLRSSQPPTP